MRLAAADVVQRAGGASTSFTIAFGLSLNGQQYVDFDDFALYNAPAVSSVAPLEASIDGGLELPPARALTTASPPHAASASPMRARRRRTLPLAAAARCRAPSADAAGERRWRTYDFDAPDEAALARLGSLHGMAELVGGALRLVPSSFAAGTALPVNGALAPPPTSPALPYFEAVFDVLMLGAVSSGGGAGLSFNNGPIHHPELLDESGSGHTGLAVSLRTGISHTVEVRLAGSLLLSAPMGRALHGGIWSPLSIRYREGTGLGVSCGQVSILDGLVLPDWSPQPSWRIALAASSADTPSLADAHWVHHLRIASGSLLDRASVAVQVSLNGQQLHPSPPLSLELLALPIVSSLHPSRGSTAGGTQIQLLGARLAGGSVRRCRFGDDPHSRTLVEATTVRTFAGGVEVRCTLPSRAAAGPVPVRVTLNGEQFSTPPVAFEYHQAGQLTSVTPISGPAEGGTLLELEGTIPNLGALPTTTDHLAALAEEAGVRVRGLMAADYPSAAVGFPAASRRPPSAPRTCPRALMAHATGALDAVLRQRARSASPRCLRA